MTPENGKYLAAVVGAGPAGLFAAKHLAGEGAHVALFNRDIKPGGLAEYGIYHNKYKMKAGLRNQFRKILDTPGIEYYGNLTIGEQGDLTLASLRGLGFQAILVTVGAQGTKWLGLPGEEFQGVYHAKDLVYHYNKLPPFSEKPHPIGKRVVIIGVGNVMMDIAHWTVRDLKVDAVTALARRGPAAIKFNKKENENVAANLDLEALKTEIERCRPAMEGVGQDPQAALDIILSGQDKALEPVSETVFRLEFLSSPRRILGDEAGKVTALEVEDTTLVLRDDGRTSAKGLGATRIVETDTVVFCIGDRIDQNFGLPLDEWKEFAKTPHPRYPIDDISHEAHDPATGEIIPDVFLAGWAREASNGLVGVARKDGVNGAKATLHYLHTLTPANDLSIGAKLAECFQGLDQPVITTADWRKLDQIEQVKAQKLGQEEYKFNSNAEMLEAIGLA